jgi:hypothetical protein
VNVREEEEEMDCAVARRDDDSHHYHPVVAARPWKLEAAPCVDCPSTPIRVPRQAIRIDARKTPWNES